MTEQQTILIIDDTPVNLRVISAALIADYRLQVAQSGAVGLQLASQAAPDLILLDVMMPEMDGFEVCRRLKEDPKLSRVPVIFLTAMGDLASEIAGLALGAADYITKPISVQTARHRIANLLERERLRKEVEAYRDQLEEKVAARTMALSIAKESVLASQQAKANFINNMSYELRTPMAVIMGFTGLSLKRATDPEQIRQLNKVDEASQQLLSLINRLMDITTLESSQLTIEKSTFDLASVLDGVALQLESEATKKGLEFGIHIEPSLRHLPLKGDALRIGQILQELTGNAIKYTSQGRVDLHVEVQEQIGKETQLSFKVRDTGIGIAPYDQKRIFVRFEELDGSPARKHGGTGIGLMLCRQLVVLMGGTIGIDISPGVGSTAWFCLRLPNAGSVQRSSDTP